MTHLFQETVDKRGTIISRESLNDLHLENVCPGLRFQTSQGRATLYFESGTLTVDKASQYCTVIPGTTRRVPFSSNLTRLVFD